MRLSRCRTRFTGYAERVDGECGVGGGIVGGGEEESGAEAGEDFCPRITRKTLMGRRGGEGRRGGILEEPGSVFRHPRSSVIHAEAGIHFN